MLTKAEFDGTEQSETFDKRYEMMKKYFDDLHANGKCMHVEVLEQTEFKTMDELKNVLEDIRANHPTWEGAILRRLDIAYKGGRSDDMLKCKDFCDGEYIVKDVDYETQKWTIPGQGIKDVECVRSLIIEHKGQICHVGSGLSHEQRLAWKDNPSLIIGKQITVKYFSESENQAGGQSLRFPTLRCIRNYE
jgi:DNA ligase-1